MLNSYVINGAVFGVSPGAPKVYGAASQNFVLAHVAPVGLLRYGGCELFVGPSSAAQLSAVRYGGAVVDLALSSESNFIVVHTVSGAAGQIFWMLSSAAALVKFFASSVVDCALVAAATASSYVAVWGASEQEFALNSAAGGEEWPGLAPAERAVAVPTGTRVVYVEESIAAAGV